MNSRSVHTLDDPYVHVHCNISAVEYLVAVRVPKEISERQVRFAQLWTEVAAQGNVWI